MAVPTLTGISANRGSTAGGEIVYLKGIGFAEQVSVFFGDAQAEVIVVREASGNCTVDLKTPSHAPSMVDVRLLNLDTDGNAVFGEESMLAAAYRFIGAELVTESDLTRLVRTLLRTIKKQIIDNTGISVSVDYDDTVVDGLNVIALSKLPSIVLSGPAVNENRFYSINEVQETLVIGEHGPDIQRNRPPYTANLVFTLTVASDRTVELLNLMAAVITFLNRNRWIEMDRDPSATTNETVRWEMDPTGEFRTKLDEGDDVRVFTCGFVVRGFDIDEKWALDLSRLVETVQLDSITLEQGGLP
jgi:hypothetical protein